jgi:hypothetical protein
VPVYAPPTIERISATIRAASSREETLLPAWSTARDRKPGRGPHHAGTDTAPSPTRGVEEEVQPPHRLPEGIALDVEDHVARRQRRQSLESAAGLDDQRPPLR